MSTEKGLFLDTAGAERGCGSGIREERWRATWKVVVVWCGVSARPRKIRPSFLSTQKVSFSTEQERKEVAKAAGGRRGRALSGKRPRSTASVTHAPQNAFERHAFGPACRRTKRVAASLLVSLLLPTQNPTQEQRPHVDFPHPPRRARPPASQPASQRHVARPPPLWPARGAEPVPAAAPEQEEGERDGVGVDTSVHVLLLVPVPVPVSSITRGFVRDAGPCGRDGRLPAQPADVCARDGGPWRGGTDGHAGQATQLGTAAQVQQPLVRPHCHQAQLLLQVSEAQGAWHRAQSKAPLSQTSSSAIATTTIAIAITITAALAPKHGPVAVAARPQGRVWWHVAPSCVPHGPRRSCDLRRGRLVTCRQCAATVDFGHGL